MKPNPESRPGSLQPEYVLEQLRAGGVLEAVRIACAGGSVEVCTLPVQVGRLRFARCLRRWVG